MTEPPVKWELAAVLREDRQRLIAPVQVEVATHVDLGDLALPGQSRSPVLTGASVQGVKSVFWKVEESFGEPPLIVVVPR